MLYDIKDIFLDPFVIDNLDENAPIVEYLIKIIDKINDPDVDANEKLMQWLKNKFEKKVMEKVAIEIVVRQVELSKLVTNLGKFSNNVNIIFINCVIAQLTQNILERAWIS